MKKMILTALTMGVLLFFTGCAQKTVDANFEKFNKAEGKQYPEITVVMTSESLQYYRDRNAVIDALKESKMFRNVTTGNPYIPFSMEINLVTKNMEAESAQGFGKMILSAGTLFLVPVDMKFNTKGYVRLRFKDILIEDIKVDSDFVTSFSAYKLGSKDVGIRGSYRKAIERVLTEIKERKSFEKLIQEPKDSVDKIDI